MIDAFPAIYEAQIGLAEALRDPVSAHWVHGSGPRLPTALKKCTRLRALSFSEGRLASLPSWVGALTTLRLLRLDENRLKGLPAEIGQLTHLTWLGLTKNQLESLPEELGALTELDSLWLDGNPKLTALPTSLFTLKKLRRLDLTNTGIAQLPAAIEGLSALEQLTLEKTPLLKSRAARAALKARFPSSQWSAGTLKIPRKRPKTQVIRVPRAQLVKLIQREQLADRAVVEGADLSKARFRRIALKGQRFAKANLQGSHWSKCLLSIDLADSQLRGAVFEDCLIEGDFEKLTFNRVDARGAIFRRCALINVGFDQADLREAHVELSPVDYGPAFTRINGEGLTVISNEAQSLSFERANLRRAVLRGRFESANFERAVLAGADLRDAVCPFASFAGTSFGDAQLGVNTLRDAEQ